MWEYIWSSTIKQSTSKSVITLYALNTKIHRFWKRKSRCDWSLEMLDQWINHRHQLNVSQFLYIRTVKRDNWKAHIELMMMIMLNRANQYAIELMHFDWNKEKNYWNCLKDRWNSIEFRKIDKDETSSSMNIYKRMRTLKSVHRHKKWWIRISLNHWYR